VGSERVPRDLPPTMGVGWNSARPHSGGSSGGGGGGGGGGSSSSSRGVGAAVGVAAAAGVPGPTGPGGMLYRGATLGAGVHAGAAAGGTGFTSFRRAAAAVAVSKVGVVQVETRVEST
jgi:hypothetical protein